MMFAGCLMILCLCAGAAFAKPFDDRPFARGEAIRAQLASLRPAARPPHMVRYPVRIETQAADMRPIARPAYLPRARWDFKRGGHLWTRTALSALQQHGQVLETIVPRDIDTWCPAYESAGPEQRRAFWAGMMSALAKHESTYNPRAVGGGNLWFGLLQIYPDTARRYECRARTGEALKDPAENLSCATRIMAVTVARDEAIAVHDGRWRGVAADWGPMSNRRKIPEMAAWTRSQSYCAPLDSVRPEMRSRSLTTLSTKSVTPLPD